jgi:hypothetical protein
METNWFSWMVPEAAMRSHVRTGFRTNLGVAETSVIIWSSRSPDVRGMIDSDYVDKRYHVPIPPQGLERYDLANGLSVSMSKPMEEWELRYEGHHDTRLDLHFTALMPPVHISETATGDGRLGVIRHGHLDQTMAVEGTVQVRGREYRVSYPSQRDHSWSPRPEGAMRGYSVSSAANFDSGHFGADFTFLVQTTNDWSNVRLGVVTNGYILDHGELFRIKHGEGRYTYLENSWVTAFLEYELEDERGRTHLFRGEPVSYYDKVGHAGSMGVVRWEASGEVGWGEYNWHGDMFEMQRLGSPT